MHISPVFGCSYFPWWNVKTHLPFLFVFCAHFSSSSPFLTRCAHLWLLLFIVTASTHHSGSGNVCYLIFQSHEGQPQHSNHTTNIIPYYLFSLRNFFPSFNFSFSLSFIYLYANICRHEKENREILNLLCCEPRRHRGRQRQRWRGRDRERERAFGANSYI